MDTQQRSKRWIGVTIVVLLLFAAVGVLCADYLAASQGRAVFRVTGVRRLAPSEVTPEIHPEGQDAERFVELCVVGVVKSAFELVSWRIAGEGVNWEGRHESPDDVSPQGPVRRAAPLSRLGAVNTGINSNIRGFLPSRIQDVYGNPWREKRFVFQFHCPPGVRTVRISGALCRLGIGLVPSGDQVEFDLPVEVP